jgi:peptide/nickel transport system permease protein
VFVLAILLQVGATRLNSAVGHQLISFSGQNNPAAGGGWLGHLGDRLDHLILPTITLLLVGASYLMLYQRNAMLDVLASDYVRTARAKGLRRGHALRKHALRTALIPSVTLFSYQFATIFVGAIFTEIIFGWHGMGEWFIDSINQNDVNAVVAVNVFAAVTVLLAGFGADLLHAALDPRVRRG